MSEITDILGAEPLIRERLEARCPGLRHVLSAADVDGVRERSQVTPAAHVLYEGYRIVEQHANGLRPLIEQTWVVVVVIRHANTGERAGAQRQTAGPLVAEVTRALIGWVPGPVYGELKLASSPYRPNYGNGFAYLPLAFTTRIAIHGDTDGQAI